jgi:lipopolysaccharide transport system ATP-binding protein
VAATSNQHLLATGATASPVAIHAESLTKEFRLTHHAYASLKGLLLSFLPRRVERITALQQVNFTIHKGETVGIIGQNGSGKSTLLGLIARVYRPTSGVLEVNGRVAPLLELGAGFHPDLTGLENIYFNGVILGLTRKQIAERLEAIVQFAELEGYIDAPIRTYSSGMLMRLGFAVAAHVDADILLVDEVLAVGDARFQQKCYDKIRQFQREGRTILFVSHDMEAITQVAARALWLDKGVLRADGDAHAVVQAYLQAMRASA